VGLDEVRNQIGHGRRKDPIGIKAQRLIFDLPVKLLGEAIGINSCEKKTR
jgi:hypothetical protein